MDVHLLKDKHFNEMFQDIKRYCDANFVKDAKHLDRYYVLLAGLLRQLLRASGSTFDPYERKLLIERVYNWYRDKRKLLLDYRLKSRRTGQQQNTSRPIRKLVNDDEDAIRLEDLDARATSKLPDIKLASKAIHERNIDTPPDTPDGRPFANEQHGFGGAHTITQLPLFVNQDKKKELFISNKLKQYSRRNLASSHQRRLQRQHEKPQSAAEPMRAASRTESWSVHTDSRPATSMSGTVQAESQSPSNKRFISQPRFANYKDDFDFSKMGVYSHWLEHRSRETEEELENVEFQDTISTWASNRARIEEEIQRRQEASRYSSQTGITVHKIIRGADNEEEESRKHRKRLEDLRQKADAFLDSDSEFSDDDRQNAPVRTNPLDSLDDAQEQDGEEEDSVPASTSEEEEDDALDSNQEPVFLSPYNNLRKVTHQFRPPSPLNPDMDLMNEGERVAASKGFVRPMTTGASAIPRTPIIAYHREVDKPVASALGAEKQPYRPKTVSVFDRKRIQHHHVHYTNPEKEHFHSVLDREGLIEEPKAKKGGRKKGGAKKKTPSKTGGAKKTKGKKGADKKAAPAAAPPPPEPVAPPPRPPSLLRSAQLDECERIKLSLAKGGWNVPTSVIERSILIPEDLSHEECRAQLPSGAFLRLECVMAEEAPAKKKKATKGKKKKGKKKKKKK